MLKETAYFPVPHGTLKQACAAARNRGVDPGELMCRVLVEGLNRLSGGVGKVELVIPEKQVHALKREIGALKQEARRRAGVRREAILEVGRTATALAKAVEAISREESM